MAEFTGVEVKTISRVLEREGYTKKVEARYYWDSHGKKVWDFQPADAFAYSELKKFELYREVQEYRFECLPAQTFDFLLLYIDGEKLSVGEITMFEELKTKIKLEVCVGAG